jgi:hypothetical protein
MRIRKIDEFREMLTGLYERFIDLRIDRNAWSRTVKAMRTWVEERNAVY